MAETADKPTNGNGSKELETIDKLSKQAKAESQFSWGKGIILGIVGKIAGSAIVKSIREAAKSNLLQTPEVSEALGKATTEVERTSIAKKAMEGVEGLRGNLLRNPGYWMIGGGIVGGLAALGFEYHSHLNQKKKSQEHIHDLEQLKQSWATRIESERQAPIDIKR